MTKIKEKRIELGLTQQGLSALLGIPKRTIEDWEGERRKCPDYVERLILDKLEQLHQRREARWKGAGMGDYYCSLCCSQYSGGDNYNYCPHCGAKMQ